MLLPPSDFTAELRRRYGIERERLVEFFHAEAWHRCLVGEAHLEREIEPYLESWGWPHGATDFLRMAFERERDEDARLSSVIRALRAGGVRCALASNQERIRGRALAERLERAGAFDALFLSFELGARKPEPAFYERVARALGVPGPGLLFFDDREENVAGAAACGWNAERFTTFESFLEQLGGYRARLELGDLGLAALP